MHPPHHTTQRRSDGGGYGRHHMSHTCTLDYARPHPFARTIGVSARKTGNSPFHLRQYLQLVRPPRRIAEPGAQRSKTARGYVTRSALGGSLTALPPDIQCGRADRQACGAVVTSRAARWGGTCRATWRTLVQRDETSSAHRERRRLPREGREGG